MWASILAKYLAPALAGIIGVENAVHSEVPGAAKKQIVLDAISAGANVGEAVPEPHVAAISELIDVVVSTLNATGVFKKTTPP